MSIPYKEGNNMITENNFIDLGLPSGTLWAKSNEEGFYTFNEAVAKHGDSLPTKEQFEELQTQCKWEWMDCGYKVTGPNGNSVFLYAAGIPDGDGGAYCVGSDCSYWSSSPSGSLLAWSLYFSSDSVDMDGDDRRYHESVRLIKRK